MANGLIPFCPVGHGGITQMYYTSSDQLAIAITKTDLEKISIASLIRCVETAIVDFKDVFYNFKPKHCKPSDWYHLFVSINSY